MILPRLEYAVRLQQMVEDAYDREDWARFRSLARQRDVAVRALGAWTREWNIFMAHDRAMFTVVDASGAAS